MKKGSCLLMVFVWLAFWPAPQALYGQEVVTLKMADTFPIAHLGHIEGKKFIKKVEELSNNKVKIEYYPAEQMGKLKDLLGLVSGGMVDIAFVPPSFLAGQLPLNTVLTLPYWTTAVEGTMIYRRLLETSPEVMQEFLKYKVRPLLISAVQQYDVGTVKKPVRSPEDLKGMKLKTSGGLFDKIAIQYGVIPVVIPSPEIYEATQRGIVEGNILPYPSVIGYRVNEIQKYNTLGARMGGYPSTFQINDKKWQSLPKDIQNVLTAAAEDYSKNSSAAWDKEQLRLAEQFEKEGMTIYRIKPEERPKWNAPLKGIEEIWIQDMEKKNLSGRKVLERFKSICQEYVK